VSSRRRDVAEGLNGIRHRRREEDTASNRNAIGILLADGGIKKVTNLHDLTHLQDLATLSFRMTFMTEINE
jgi:hypothetical protein